MINVVCRPLLLVFQISNIGSKEFMIERYVPQTGRLGNKIRYPDDLLDKWDHYDAEKGSENDRPDASLFGLQQKFVVLELKNGGQDLENVTLTNAAQGYAIFQQVAHALAIAEESLKFEHRDLHWDSCRNFLGISKSQGFSRQTSRCYQLSWDFC